MNVMRLFDLSDRVVIVTGGAGFLARQHAAAVAEAGGTPVLLDIRYREALDTAGSVTEETGRSALALETDITDPEAVERALRTVLDRFGRVDALINNAANNPKMEPGAENDTAFERFETFPLELWHDDITVGVTGALICCQVFGSHMAANGGGSIVNIASDLAVIAPDQRIYRKDGLPEHRQPVKPVTYSVVKSALLGLNRYLATYWATAGVRVNAISPAGVFNDHDEAFVRRLSDLIPMGRMTHRHELKGAIVFLCSDASSFITGHNLLVDGGRTCW